MREGHEIIDKVYAAKSDPDAADSLIRQYMGFIRSETAKFLHRPPEEGRDEEFSIAMLAFYESILGYEKGRGVFLSYAARGIRNRLIDHYRKEKRHANLSSLHEPVEDDVADNCPRQSRTFAACQKVLAAARLEPELLQEMINSKKLPMTALAAASGVEKKTLERHRKYLVAVLLAFTNGYEIIRGHLYQMSSSEGADKREGNRRGKSKQGRKNGEE